MLKALIFFLASLGLVDGDSQDNDKNDVKDEVHAPSQSQGIPMGPNGSPESDDDDSDNKHSTKEGL